jgi:cardiolipin synthase
MKYSVLSDPKKIYSKMLSDIGAAKKEVFLETYIYGNDEIGKKFLDVLTKKAREGVRVRLLVDSWGSGVRKSFFEKLVESGGEVRFFREFRYVIRLINANHERNHRKLLIVDKEISYVGSVNITSSCLNWSELVLRIEGPLSKALRISFNRTWKKFNSWSTEKVKRILHEDMEEDMEVIQSLPSRVHNLMERSYKKIIKKARKEVFIETPYFVPSRSVRASFKEALDRGVKIKIILPKVSDARMLDIFRNRYLGRLHRMGVEIYYFPGALHSKLLVVDDSFFLFGSSNLDYRSFIHQYEIDLLGRNKDVVDSLRKSFLRDLRKSTAFSYVRWKNRSFFRKMVEWVMGPFRKYY